MRVYAWRHQNFTNFGDELGYELLKRILGDVERVANPAAADIISIGSILGSVRYKPGTVVWGSGFIKANQLTSSGLKFAAVRGRLTAVRLSQLGVWTESCAMGDPAVLVPRFWPKSDAKSDDHVVGWIPHYIDDKDPGGWNLKIDVRAPVDEVISQISSCRAILSSSLHGCIVADAFGIPSMRLHHEAVIGGNFKWADYMSARSQPINLTQDRLLRALRAALPSQ